MVVDKRHDHSFRIPRPDLSVTLGTPNACNDCHRDQPATWAAAAIETWHGPVRKGFQSYDEAFHAARTDHADAAALLAVVAADQTTPGIARGDRPERARRAPLVIDHPVGAKGIHRSRSDGADRCARHARKPADVTGLAARF